MSYSRIYLSIIYFVPILIYSQVKYVLSDNALIDYSYNEVSYDSITENKIKNTIHLSFFGPEFNRTLSQKTSLSFKSSWILSPVSISLKHIIFSKGKIHFSINGVLISSGFINQFQTYGGYYSGILTLGTKKLNISFTGGLAHINWPNNNTNFMNGVREIGDKYSYSFYDENHPYFIPEYNYNAQMAFEESLGINNLFSNSDDRYLYRNKQLATVIGVSVIAPIGKKASFIFDSMIFIAKKSKVNYTTKEKEINYEVYNNATGNSQTTSFTAIYGEGVISPGTTKNITFILMPAIRFNKSYKKAFQVALAGFINYNEINGLNTAPFPMFSLTRKF